MGDLTRSAAQGLAAECLCLAANRAARALARRYDQALRPAGLTSGQFALLAGIAGLQPAPIPALAELLGMDRTTVTAALKPLAREGLVVVEAGTEDRRLREIHLTAEGRERLQQAKTLWRQAQQEATRLLGSTSPASLLANLARLR